MSLFAKLAIALFAPVMLFSATAYAVDPAVADSPIINGLCAGANLKVGSTCQSSSGNATQQINKIVRLIINTLSLVVGIVAVVMIIIGGLRYVTSGGNDSSVTSAKNTILYAIIGLIIVAMSQFAVRFVLGKLTS